MPPISSPKNKSWLLLVFSEPLCYFGSICLVGAAYKALNPPVNWSNFVGVAALGLSLMVAGLAIVQSRRHYTKNQIQIDRNRALYPESPWMWPEDWSQGHAQSKNRISTMTFWVVAFFWSLFSTAVLVDVLNSKATTGERWEAVVLSAVGVVLLILVVYRTIRREKFGKSWFELATLPGVIGKELRGSIHVNFSQPPEEGVVLKLNCVNRVMSAGGMHQTHTDAILWSEEYTLPSSQVHDGPSGSALPVVFKIPTHAKGTSTENPKDRILWFLRAHAKMPGVDYQDIFEVPVFHTPKGSTVTADKDSDVFLPTIDAGPPGKPFDSGILVKPAESGGTEFDFSAARNPWLAFRETLAFLCFTGIIGFLSKGAELIFLAPFMILDLVLFVSVLLAWFGTSKVVIGSGRVQIHKGLLGLGSTREVPFPEINRILMPIGSYGERIASTAYYDIKLRLNGREQVELASAIRNKREVEWLIAQMKELIGLK